MNRSTKTALDTAVLALDAFSNDNKCEFLTDMLRSIKLAVICERDMPGTEDFYRRLDALQQKVETIHLGEGLSQNKEKLEVLDSTVAILVEVKQTLANTGPLHIAMSVNDYWSPIWGEA